MTPEELAQARAALGLTGDMLGALTGHSGRMVRIWERGENAKQSAPIPRAVEIIVTLALKFPAVRRELGIHGRKKTRAKGQQAKA